MLKPLALLLALAIPAYGQDMLLTGAGSPKAAGGGGGGPVPGLGDKQPGAYTYWGLRAYDSTAATSHQKVVRLCNSSGGGCTDVLANTNGTITLPAAGACGGANCTGITTLYDQSRALSCGGAACDLTQPNAASMPPINTTGGVIGLTLQGGFGGFFMQTGIGSVTLSSTAFSISSVASPLTTSTSGGMLYFGAASTGAGVGFNSTSGGASVTAGIGSGFGSSNQATTGAYQSVQYMVANSTNTNGSQVDLEGTVTNGTNAGGFGFTSDGFFLADESANSVGIMEIGMWNSNISSNFAVLLANQQAYCTSIGGSC